MHFIKITTLLIISIILSACAGTPPSKMGLINNEFYPCPNTPNCVSSFAPDEAHYIKPLMIERQPDQVFEQLIGILEADEQAVIIKQSPRYIYAEYHSTVLGFVDDVEFLLRPEAIHVRSASRLGYSDLGVNRERIEVIRRAISGTPAF